MARLVRLICVAILLTNVVDTRRGTHTELKDTKNDELIVDNANKQHNLRFSRDQYVMYISELSDLTKRKYLKTFYVFREDGKALHDLSLELKGQGEDEFNIYGNPFVINFTTVFFGIKTRPTFNVHRKHIYRLRIVAKSLVGEIATAKLKIVIGGHPRNSFRQNVRLENEKEYSEHGNHIRKLVKLMERHDTTVTLPKYKKYSNVVTQHRKLPSKKHHIETNEGTVHKETKIKSRQKRQTPFDRIGFEIVENKVGLLFNLTTWIESNDSAEFRLVSSTLDIFDVTADGGLYLKTGESLDYDDSTKRNIDITFEITTSEATTVRTGTITVTDANDEVPFFTNRPRPFLATVSATASAGTRVFKLSAKDPDTDSRISFSLVTDDPFDVGNFEIVDDSTSKFHGEIRKVGNGALRQDYEFTLRVSAEDINAQDSRQISEIEDVRILVGTRPPQFFESSYMATLSENNVINYKFKQIEALSFQGGSVSFEIRDGTDTLSTIFSVDDGFLMALRTFDYESDPVSYNFNIVATELNTGLQSTCPLNIVLLDVNEFDPECLLKVYSADIPENQDVGSTLVTVKARDKDASHNFTFSVDDEHFQAVTENEEGHIKVAIQLDYDRTVGHQYLVNINVTDNADSSRFGTCTVIVHVTDVNDENPVFINSLQSTVPENAEPFTVVMSVHAVDPDGKAVRYSFSDGSDGGKRLDIFRLNPTSGEIVLMELITRYQTSFSFNVTAFDNEDDTQQAMAVVQIDVLDINNHKPIFESCNDYSPIVVEEKGPGEPIVKVSATDSDRGENSRLTYSLPRITAQDGYFQIDDRTGMINTSKNINRENLLSDEIQVMVEAIDHGNPRLKNFCLFTVTVEDINDNTPIFSDEKYAMRIKQTQTIGANIFTAKATDADNGKNAKIEYSITHGNDEMLFAINNQTGKITVAKSLENMRSVNLTMMAQDHGDLRLNTTATVTIAVETIEENLPPTWADDYDSKPITVNETFPVDDIIQAFQAISTQTVGFSFVSGGVPSDRDRNFRILSNASHRTEVLLKLHEALNYTRGHEFQLTIRVQNLVQGSFDPVSSHIYPTIHVIDENNEVPVFVGLDVETTGYTASVAENSKPGTVVYTVSAIDADTNPKYKNVTYSIDPSLGINHFQINDITGEITTSTSFDREEDGLYTSLWVIASDGAPSTREKDGSHNSATVVVRVEILDINDNHPQFEQTSYSVTVPENAKIGATVLTVSATDRDPTHSFKYWLNSSTSDFAINFKSGAIFVTRLLDFEVSPNVFDLPLVVSDGLFVSTSVATINLEDVNDNPPKFSEVTYFVQNVTEEDTTITSQNPHKLVQVNAVDADADSVLHYTLDGDLTDGKNRDVVFEISNDGIVSLLAPLDRDPPIGKPTYQLNVLASDGVNIGYASVVVQLIDINDNVPVFDESSLHGEIDEESATGSEVMTIIATDADDGENKRITYTIFKQEPESINSFAIDRNSGVIQTSRILDHETISEYRLTIVARDNGADFQNVTATATVLVKDINDNPPRFTKRQYNVGVSEHQVSGVVAVLSATDNDTVVDNGHLWYQLSPPDSMFFSLRTICTGGSCKGLLEIMKPVDFENVTQKQFTFDARVYDTGNRSDEARVFITVEDYNDNAPEFTVPWVTLENVREDFAVGEQIADLTVMDIDSGVNNQTDFFVSHSSTGEESFAVDENGYVTIENLMDYELSSTYTVFILAIDRGIPPLTGTATLSITLQDVNDVVPQIAEPTTRFLKESSTPNPSVFSISAIDGDSTSRFGAPFVFSLPCDDNCPCPENPTCDSFSLQFDKNGDGRRGVALIGTRKKFDREEQSIYLIPIIIVDMGSSGLESLTGTSTLTIEIEDVNDNRISAGQKDILVYNYKGLFGDIVIGTVFVEDKDDNDIADQSFSYNSPVEFEGHFSIDKASGNITLSKNVPSGSYSFKVQVYDAKFQTTVISSVNVDVQEISDTAVYSSGSVRLKGTTVEKFIFRPKTGSGMSDYGTSPYENFRDLLANKLQVPTANVFIVSVMNNGEFTDVRYAAHGSPWYKQSELDGLVYLSLNEFQNAASANIVMVTIDECQQERCRDGGCYSELVVTEQPILIDAKGTSFVTMSISVVGKCGCRATSFTAPVDCTPVYCYNGGTCVKDDWGVLSCTDCPPDFDGPRCQETRHSFNGQSYALYEPLEQCLDGRTSLEFITTEETGLLMYDGPTADLTAEEPSDFLLLELIAGYPHLRLDLGSGEVALSLNGSNKNGSLIMQKLNDGKWHRVDIIKRGKFVKLMVDHCEQSEEPPEYLAQDRLPCEIIGYTRGENTYLNVHGPLQLGGRFSRPSYPVSVTPTGFNGCIKNVVHNGKLYDLNTGSSEENGCSREDAICNAQCGDNGVCTAMSLSSSAYTCTCNPGYRGDTCQHETTLKYLATRSFLDWRLKTELSNEISRRQSHIQLQCRTRDSDGIIFSVTSLSLQEYIRLEIISEVLQLSYNIGNGQRVIHLEHASVSNGQWHTISVKRYDREFLLKMDGGEGQFYSDSVRSDHGDALLNFGSFDVFFDIRPDQVFSGALVYYNNLIPVENQDSSQDLSESCMNDVRMEMRWFPMKESENFIDAGAQLQNSPNTRDSCARQDCVGVRCPDSSICVPLWGHYECRCQTGMEMIKDKCIMIDHCASSPCHGTASCQNNIMGFTCVCPPGWNGTICIQKLSKEDTEDGLNVAGIAGIVVGALVFLLLIIALLLFLSFRKHGNGGKTVIYEEYDDDFRENIAFSDEEGAGEEDFADFDMSYLQKPMDLDSERDHPRMDVPKVENPKLKSSYEPDSHDYLSDKRNLGNSDLVGPPPDSLREYGFEGMDSEVGSLSSVNTASSSSGDHDYNYLNDWGPKFSTLASMYNDHDDNSD